MAFHQNVNSTILMQLQKIHQTAKNENKYCFILFTYVL